MTDTKPVSTAPSPHSATTLGSGDFFIQAFVDATVKMMKDPLQVDAQPGMRCHRKLDKLPPAEVSVVCHFSGTGTRGIAILSFSQTLFKSISTKLTTRSDYDPATGAPEELAKWISEIQARVVSEMKTKGFPLEGGFCSYISGKEMNPVFLTHQSSVAVPFETKEGVFHGEFVFYAPQELKVRVPPGIRIMVAEDSPMARKGIIRFLNNLGLSNIVEVTNGEDAWSGLQGAVNMNKPFDLVLTDWNMPKMSGLELLKKVRGFDKTKALRFVIFTGEQDVEHVKAALQAGVSGYIVKPVIQEVLGKKLEALWAAPAPTAAPAKA